MQQLDGLSSKLWLVSLGRPRARCFYFLVTSDLGILASSFSRRLLRLLCREVVLVCSDGKSVACRQSSTVES